MNWLLLLASVSPSALAGEVYEDAFLSDKGLWEGGTILEGSLWLSGESATLSLPESTELSGTLVLRQRDAASLSLRLDGASWGADYTDTGSLSLGEQRLHFPHGHRDWQTEAEPVLEPSSEDWWESGSVLHCDVHYDESSGTWLLYYTGVMSPGYGYRQINVATSSDGETWTRYAANPVITIDYDLTTVDGVHAHMPSVVVDGEGTFHLYYACYQNGVGNRICHASSEDGLAWTRPDYGAGRVALDLGEAGAFDDASVREPDVSVAQDGSFQMLYVGTRVDEHYGPAGLAQSIDGGWTWERLAQLTEGEGELQGGSVLQSAYGLEQWYQCDDAFCFAESTGTDEEGAVDWSDWTLHEDPVLTKNWASWNSGYIQAPSAWLDEDYRVHLWFNAYDYDTGLEVLGHARSAPRPDQWVEVQLAWDGSELRVSFDGGPELTTALDSVSTLVLESTGEAEIDEIRLEWTPRVDGKDTGIDDTGDTDDTGGGEETGEDESGEEGGSSDSGPREKPEDSSCGCTARYRSTPLSWPLGLGLLLGLIRTLFSRRQPE
jgi:hypothetical protein